MNESEIANLKQLACDEIDRLRPDMDRIAREIHQDPEVGWETPNAVRLLTNFLGANGLQIEHPVAGLTSAFRAVTAGRHSEHPSVCMLAEYDALPDIGHGCGHNLIGTVASGAAAAVSKVITDAGIPGAVYVMGCPFEEGGGGKILMLEHGIFDVADASLMWHAPNNPSDRIVVGNPNNAAQNITFKFYGKPSHAALSPDKGINALDGTLITMTAINALRQHLTPDIRIAHIVTAGGDAANVVPGFAEMKVSIRARNRGILNAVIEKVQRCAEAGALASGATLETELGLTYNERIVLQRFRRLALDNLPLLGLPREERDPHLSGSADSANVSHQIPHLTFRVPISTQGDLIAHTPEFAAASDTDAARDGMNLSAKLMAMCAIDLITVPGLLEELRTEHRERLLESQADA